MKKLKVLKLKYEPWFPIDGGKMVRRGEGGIVSNGATVKELSAALLKFPHDSCVTVDFCNDSSHDEPIIWVLHKETREQTPAEQNAQRAAQISREASSAALDKLRMKSYQKLLEGVE